VVLAIVAVSDGDKGKNEGAVWTGITRWEGDHLSLDREAGEVFEVPDDVLDRVKPVPSSVAELLFGADFYITMSIARRR
jgi:hypothetical protein